MPLLGVLLLQERAGLLWLPSATGNFYALKMLFPQYTY